MPDKCQSCAIGPQRHYTGEPDHLWICDRCLTVRHGGQLITLQVAAERLDVSLRTVRRLVDAGKLTTLHITARTVRVRASDVEALINGKNRQDGTVV